jgi:HNH endonuclease
MAKYTKHVSGVYGTGRKFGLRGMRDFQRRSNDPSHSDTSPKAKGRNPIIISRERAVEVLERELAQTLDVKGRRRVARRLKRAQRLLESAKREIGLATRNKSDQSLVSSKTIKPAAGPNSAESSAAEPHAAQSLPVPTPHEKTPDQTVTYITREGQDDFRSRVLASYGCCAVTGCVDEVVLQAAHIIPYVDTRSHIINNGICLRADIHCLFDKGLISVNEHYVLTISSDVQSNEYRNLDGKKLMLPTNPSHWPDTRLLAARHDYL